MDYATPTRFSEICRRVGISDMSAGEIFADLEKRYHEDHRKYHNLSHIDRMLGWLDAASETNDSVELAIWFHDAVYDPLGSDNEAQSARYFRDYPGKFFPNSISEQVERLILATDPTQSRSRRADENLIVDIDLTILGASPDDYLAYRDAIRCEYSAVSEVKFVAGRRSILLSFLSQRIYSTDYFFERFERQARLNIQEELEVLEKRE